MVASIAVRKAEKNFKRKTPKPKINKEFARKKPLPGATAEETVKQYHYFAVKTAREYLNRHPGTKLDFDDAYAIVCMALCRAHEKYDSDKGANFITYASQWARAYLDQKGDFKHRLIHIPPRQLKKYIKERFALSAYDGEVSPLYLTKPSKEIYNEIRKDKAKLAEVRKCIKAVDDLTYLSHLESPIKNNNNTISTLGGLLTDEEQLNPEELTQAEQIRERLNFCIEKLDEREKYIIKNRIMVDEPPSLAAIGKEWGISRERIRQLEARAFKKLKLFILNDSVLSQYENLLQIRIPTEKKLAEPHKEQRKEPPTKKKLDKAA